MKAIGSRWVFRTVRSGQHRPLLGADWYFSIVTEPAPRSRSYLCGCILLAGPDDLLGRIVLVSLVNWKVVLGVFSDSASDAPVSACVRGG